MDSRKIFTLGILAAALMMALPGTSAATTITSSSGSTPFFTAESGEITIHGAATVTCESSKVQGSIESHGSGVTAKGNISEASGGECGTNEVSGLTWGSVEVHATSGGNGTVTSSGGEVSIHLNSLGITCIYTTSNTKLGTITGGSPAQVDIESASIPRTGGSFFCGSSGTLTASYTVSSPFTLSVDS